MMNVYEGIIAGLMEAMDDARGERPVLKRHTIESSYPVTVEGSRSYVGD